MKINNNNNLSVRKSETHHFIFIFVLYFLRKIMTEALIGLTLGTPSLGRNSLILIKKFRFVPYLVWIIGVCTNKV